MALVKLIEGTMNPEIKARWIQALRQGNFQQFSGQLSGGSNLRCVLGVLAEVYMTDHEDAHWDYTNRLVLTSNVSRFIRKRIKNRESQTFYWENVRRQTYVQREPATFMLPSKITDWAALEIRDSNNSTIQQLGFKVDNELVPIGKLNDKPMKGRVSTLSFIELSDMIERQL
jgi:hypothetical protein